MALSIKHQRFVEEYLQNSNATDAYQTVYPGVNRTTAASNGWRLLRNARIAEAIQARLDQAAMPADEVLSRITDHARADIDDFLNADGSFDLTKARRGKRTALLKKLKTKTTTRTVGEMEVQTVEVEFELHDAQAALVHLGKYHKLFIDRSENRNYDIDLSKLTNEQLERVAAGEDPLQVVIDGYIATNKSSG